MRASRWVLGFGLFLAPACAMDAAGSSAAGSSAAMHCSGCADEKRDPMDMTVHLHHVHLKSANRERSLSFYEKRFGAKRINLNGVTEALLVTPTIYLIDEVATAPRSDLPVSLQHIGFGSTDVAAWFEKAHADGVMPDTRGNTLFNTSETPTVGAPGSGSLTNQVLGAEAPSCFPLDADAFGYIYVLGPDQERIEIWTGAEQRVNHVHFTTPDLAAAVGWYQKFLGVGMNASTVLTSNIFIDDVLFFYEPIGAKEDYEPTEDYVLSHIALSVTDLAKWVQRARDQHVEIVAEPAPVHGWSSFFVRGPDGLLVELVEAAKSPLLCPSGPVTARPPSSGAMP